MHESRTPPYRLSFHGFVLIHLPTQAKIIDLEMQNCCKHAAEKFGAHCARALITGEQVEGTWFNRSLEYNASLRREMHEERKYASVEVVHLSPLPCWKHLPN